VNDLVLVNESDPILWFDAPCSTSAGTYPTRCLTERTYNITNETFGDLYTVDFTVCTTASTAGNPDTSDMYVSYPSVDSFLQPQRIGSKWATPGNTYTLVYMLEYPPTDLKILTLNSNGFCVGSIVINGFDISAPARWYDSGCADDQIIHGDPCNTHFTYDFVLPTAAPTAMPTVVPTAVPTANPTTAPTAIPTVVPTAVPTATPTATHTAPPSAVPTVSPTAVPTFVATAPPSASPTNSTDEAGDGPTTLAGYPNCNVSNPPWVGDGYCDHQGDYNSLECGYDGGDCCAATCQSGPSTCGEHGYHCDDPNAQPVWGNMDGAALCGLVHSTNMHNVANDWTCKGAVPSTPPCGSTEYPAWRGIKCSPDGRVMEVSWQFTDYFVQGHIDASIRHLTEVIILDFHHQMLKGPIEPELGNLPKLQFLDLSVNLFTGKLPNTFRHLKERGVEFKLRGNLLENHRHHP